MNDKELYALCVGAILPALISVITQARWSSRVKSIVALCICGLAGAGTSYYAGDLTVGNIGRSIMLVVIAAQTAYRAFWSPTGASKAIQGATDVGGK